MAPQNEKEDSKGSSSSRLRAALATLIVITVIAYTWGVITGYVPEHRKIDMVNLAVIAFALIVSLVIMSPGIFDRIKIFQVSSFKLELLEKVKEKQAEQESRLDDITLMLPLLLPIPERTHLLNIAVGKTGEYKGGHSLRSELRNLRSAGLIKSKPQTYIAEMKDDVIQDISKLVELTTLGTRWVNRIKEIEQFEKETM